MKIIFFGSSNFAVPILEALHRRENVSLAVTQPDRKKGRSLKISQTPVKNSAERLGIKVFQEANVNSQASIDYLKSFNADLFIVVSFGQILSRALLGLPKLYSLNIHASLLPKYRGASPINWALANGEKETGVTIIKMNEKMDEGDILLKEAVPLNNEDDAITVSEKLSKSGAGLLSKALELIKSNKANFLAQDNDLATYAPKLKKEDGLIDWDLPAGEIYNKIRAFVPWPGCFTLWDTKALKILGARTGINFFSNNSKPGTVLKVDKTSILVSTGKGALAIGELQLENKRRMKVEEFIAGHKKMIAGVTFLKK